MFPTGFLFFIRSQVLYTQQ